MADCPQVEELQALLVGVQLEQQDAWIEVHVSGCSVCQGRLETLMHDPQLEQWRSAWRDVTHVPAATDTEQDTWPESIGLPSADEMTPQDEELPSHGNATTSTADTTKALLEEGGVFRDLQELGRGSFGIVYRARSDLHRAVAIKILKPERAGDRKEVQRFEKEARSAASIQHENVVRIHQVGATTDPALPYIVMEYIQGESLHDRLMRERRLAPRQAVKIARQIARGLAAAHARNVIHRDIKPRNIMLEADSGCVKIADFGLAFVTEETATRASESGNVAGTAHYMSPEQIRTPQRVDGRADVYSLGVVLFEMLTGERPFRGTGHALLMQVVHDEPPSPKLLEPAISRDLDTVIQRCLAKQPARRYANAGELADDLTRFLDRKPVHARPVGRMERTVRWCRRKPWAAMAAVLGILLVVFSAAFAVSKGREAEKQKHLRQETARLLRKTEVLQTKFQMQAIDRALQNNDYGPISDAYVIPSAVESWDTQLLLKRRNSQPKVTAALVDGNWGILAAASNEQRSRLVTTDSGGLLSLWNLETARLVRQLKEGRWSEEGLRWEHYLENRPKGGDFKSWGPCYTAVCWLPDSTRIMVASLDGTASLVDTETGVVEQVLDVDEPLYTLSLSSDGSHVLLGGAGGGLHMLTSKGKFVHRASHSDSAVTAIVPTPDTGEWIIGREDGRIQMCGAQDLSLQADAKTSGPIWSLDLIAAEERLTLAVAGGDPEIRLYQASREQPALTPIGTLARPNTSRQPVVYHSVRFAASGDVYAIDEAGELTGWTLNTRLSKWRMSCTKREELRGALKGLAKSHGFGDQLPIPLRRVGSVILDGPRPGQLITAGDDTAVKIWQIRDWRDDVVTRLKTTVGDRPRILFDQRGTPTLWALDWDGTLRVVDCAMDKLLFEEESHHGGAADLAFLHDNQLVASVGGDKTVCFWQIADGKLRQTHKGKFQHDQALIGLAVSPDEQWIAVVDVTARLAVWELKSGTQVCLTSLSPDAEGVAGDASLRPLTGRVAFNCDGTRLSAFGAGQSAPIFTTSSFRRIDEQIQVAGTGGTAMMWNPLNPNVVSAADDFPRLAMRGLGSGDAEINRRGKWLFTMCVTIVNTPDRRRVVTVEKNGRILFHESENLIEMLEVRSKFDSVSDATFDHEGRRMAIAGVDGAIVIWDSGAVGTDIQPAVEDATSRWSSVQLVEPTSKVIRMDDRMIRLDAIDRLGILYTESTPSDFRADGSLYFVRSDLGYGRREQLELDDSPSNRRATHEAASLEFGPDADPRVVFRLRTALNSPYDGSVILARRIARDKWHYETILEHGNWGFYPLLQLDKTGAPIQLLHFAFAGYYLVQSVPAVDGSAEWSNQYIGLQGDGLYLHGRAGANGDLHLAFTRNRVGNVPGGPVYARWDGAELHREIVDPFQVTATDQMTFAPDGNPVVRLEQTLMRRTEDGWTKYAELPSSAIERFAISPTGEVYGVSWDQHNDRLLIWYCFDGKWSAEAIAGQFDGDEPNWCTIRLNSSGQPVVVVARCNEPYGWIKMFRPNARVASHTRAR